jgi:hypothetical protein
MAIAPKPVGRKPRRGMLAAALAVGIGLAARAAYASRPST